jgi:hypothetical protein
VVRSPDFTNFGGCGAAALRWGFGGSSLAKNQSAQAVASLEIRPGGVPEIMRHL